MTWRPCEHCFRPPSHGNHAAAGGDSRCAGCSLSRSASPVRVRGQRAGGDVRAASQVAAAGRLAGGGPPPGRPPVPRRPVASPTACLLRRRGPGAWGGWRDGRGQQQAGGQAQGGVRPQRGAGREADGQARLPGALLPALVRRQHQLQHLQQAAAAHLCPPCERVYPLPRRRRHPRLAVLAHGPRPPASLQPGAAGGLPAAGGVPRADQHADAHLTARCGCLPEPHYTGACPGGAATGAHEETAPFWARWAHGSGRQARLGRLLAHGSRSRPAQMPHPLAKAHVPQRPHSPPGSDAICHRPPPRRRSHCL